MDNKDLIKRFNVVIEDMESLHLKITRDKEYVARSIELLYGLMNDVYSEMCAYSSKAEQEAHNFLVVGSNPAARTKELEQLCNDLFNYVCAETIGIYITREQFVELSERMCDLGLMEEFYD